MQRGVAHASYSLQGECDYLELKEKKCGPYRHFSCFRLDAAIAATEGKVHLAMVDIDEHADLAISHGVSAVPTVVAFKDGKMRDKFVGLADEDKLDAFVQKLAND